MPTTNITLRIPNDELERIDEAAKAAGQTRSEYVLSWGLQHYAPEDLAFKEQLQQEQGSGELLG